MEAQAILSMTNITKEFPGVKALDQVDFELWRGEVHSLLGENGAGKSTLIKVLGGIYEADGGQIVIDGQPVAIHSVEDSKDQGISIIHQELVLVPHMTVAENIFLGREPMKGLGIDRDQMARDTQTLLNEFDLSFSPWDRVSELTIANQQMVEIIKAVSVDCKILVMDEPTSSISDKEVALLFDLIRKLKTKGLGIIYVSHKMSELDQICDRVTIMRDGQSISTYRVGEVDRQVLIAEMVGRDLGDYFQRESNVRDEVILSVRDLSDGELLENIDFDLKVGEILGFAGLNGAGRSELMECIFGLRAKTDGEVRVFGNLAEIEDPSDALVYRMAMVPEDRKASALFHAKSVRYNMTINVLDQFMTPWSVERDVQNGICQLYIKSLQIKTPSLDYKVDKLSGGNQQKAVIARWLATKPQILILDEPTRGVDIGAKSEIYAMMNKLAKNGMAIIMISSELPEVINLSDRVYVMSNGKIAGELTKDDMTQDNIMKLAVTNL